MKDEVIVLVCGVNPYTVYNSRRGALTIFQNHKFATVAAITVNVSVYISTHVDMLDGLCYKYTVA